MATSFHVIIFSKDRAWQLQELLLSLYNHILIGGHPYTISVLYKAERGGEYWESYQKLEKDFPAVDFIVEENFGRQLEGLLGLREEFSENGRYEFVMFAVDDMLFYDAVDLSAVKAALTSDPEISTFHTKLHPGIRYSQTADKVLAIPEFRWNAHLREGGFVYELDKAEGDWLYPWDLCGSIYRLKDARAMILELIEKRGPDSISNPNRLEFSGDRLLKQYRRQKKSLASFGPKASCSSRPVMSVLTINRVQDVYDNPIYTTDGGDTRSLDRLLWEGRHLDTGTYRSSAFDSVHIGSVFFCSDGEENRGVSKLSVVIPVYNGLPYLEDSIRSVLKDGPESMEVLIIDDGSTDGSFEIIRKLEKEDRRIRSISHVENKGLAYTLNEALREATGEFVARHDADDQVIPGRFKHQMDFLLRNEDCDVVGGGILLHSCGDSTTTKVINYPTNPVFLKWCMYFSCNLAHPTVMYRKGALEECRTSEESKEFIYDPKAFPAEDYDLWLRILKPGARNVRNLTQPLSYVRKHGKNTSLTQRAAQISAADLSSFAAVKRLLEGREVQHNHLTTLRRISESQDLGDMVGAADLLLAMEQAFIQKEVENSCSSDSKPVAVGEKNEASMSIEERIGLRLVRRDVTNRLKELAVFAISQSGAAGVSLMTKAMQRPNNP